MFCTINVALLCETDSVVAVADIVSSADLKVEVVHEADLQRSVSWVATSELPDPAVFFRGGEVLLTTGLQTVRWRRKWFGYVERLAAARVIAIGLGTGLTYDHPPQALIEACRSCDMNLLNVPRATPFVAISQRVSELLTEQDERHSRTAWRTQRSLTAAAAKPAASQRILEVLAKAHGAAALFDADGQVVIAPVGARRAELAPEHIAAEIRQLRQATRRAAATLIAATGSVVVQPLQLSGRRAHYLAVATVPRLSEGQQATITTAVALLSLLSEQRRAATDAVRALRSRALELAVAGHADTARLILSVEPGGATLPEEPVVLRAAGAGQHEDALSALEQPGMLAGHYRGELCVCASAEDGRRVADRLAAAGMRVGRGQSGADLAAAYRMAGLALAQAPPGWAVAWNDLVRDGPLGLLDPSAAQEYAVSLLGDMDRGQRKLLRSFVSHHGSVLKVAHELAMHRNTVRNRMAAIEAMLGRSLDDPQMRFSVWMALQILPE